MALSPELREKLMETLAQLKTDISEAQRVIEHGGNLQAQIEALLFDAQPTAPKRSGISLHKNRKTDGWESLTTTTAVERILAEADMPLSRKLIVEALEQVGWYVLADNVSASLTYLKDHGRAKRSDNGEWSIILDTDGEVIDLTQELIPLPAQGGSVSSGGSS
jgi:hypothetical protein